MSIYELAILGNPPGEKRRMLEATLKDLIADFELQVGDDVAIRSAEDFDKRNIRAATAAVYFCDGHIHDRAVIETIVFANVPIIPIVPEGESFSLVPKIVAGANGLMERADDSAMTEIATALLECVGLLRKQRRVFISYRRQESRIAAVQLHDALSAKCFDVFLDTHKIRPGEPFQDVLWNRLSDCDVLIMLDTPGYFDSRWTREEIGRARVKNIHVLRVVWPNNTPNKMTDLAETIYLEDNQFKESGDQIVEASVDEIVLAVERLRSRSIAARYLAIAGKLRAEAIKAGVTVTGLGAFRAMEIILLNGEKVWAYPVVGIPNAELLNEIAEKGTSSSNVLPPIMVYDHLGVNQSWASHLEWLNSEIEAVDLLKVSEAGWELASWGECK